MEPRKIGVLYIPVIHRGYLNFIETLRDEGVRELYIVGDDILEKHEELDYLNRKDRLRALSVAELKTSLSSLVDIPVAELTEEVLKSFSRDEVALYMPAEDINAFLARTYFPGWNVQFGNVFLRRHKDNVEGGEEEGTIPFMSMSAFQQSIFHKVLEEAEKSADWWRQVGAALVKNDRLVALAHNEHMPEAELPNIYGDSRSLYKKGVNVEYVTAAHAEVGVIGEVAKKGIATDGSELFLTDFPCPYCARLIAKSGIKKVYFMKGYAVLGGEDFFHEMGIEVIRVG